MLKKVNFKSLHGDLRKLGITFLIGGFMGLILGPHSQIVPLSFLTALGLIFWYLGLSDGELD